ncbi:hypothetical protein WMY93_000351 [Mugilogobius chulae]|uniref:Uncharacterized protein n=1 Tax=Mugilogobius chulae TaxID=88201 RepID=A0AAW0Q0N0_9GOBI
MVHLMLLVKGDPKVSPPPVQPPVQPTAAIKRPPPPRPPPPQLPLEQELSQWCCSHQQKVWMKLELESMGLWPGSRPVSNLMKSFSLWRLPPQPELIDNVDLLPSPKYFQLHPFFIWKPESDYLMGGLCSALCGLCWCGQTTCDCGSHWTVLPAVIPAVLQEVPKEVVRRQPPLLEKLPQRFTNLLPALLTYKKAICKSVLDELRRTGKSPGDMANQITESLHLKYERANLAYLLCCQNVMGGEAGTYGQMTITKFLRQETTPKSFGGYSDSDGWNGVSVSSHYLSDCLLHEFQHQRNTILRLLQGTFGQALRSDHTRKVARKVMFSSGTMSSYAVMNENWMILSWVMVQSETEKSLRPLYEGLSKRYTTAGIEKACFQWVDRDCCAAFRVAGTVAGEDLSWEAWRTTDAIVAEVTSGNLLNTCASRSHYNDSIIIKLDLFHCMRRFLRECASEHHPLYSSFAQFLSAAFCVVDQDDLQRLKDAYVFCGIQPANPTKQHIREHCRTMIPQPRELVQRVEGVFHHFHQATDPNGVPLFKPSMLQCWRIQRVHILRGCLSDPEVEGGILYRHGGTLQLNHVPGEGASVPVWIPIRGTSQQEGYHFHQAQWVTGTQVSPELFQAQGLTGVCRWNFQRLVDLKQPGVSLPAVFDPALMQALNTVSKRVLGEEKYPALHLSAEDTGERFGLEYTEPECRPVPLDWDKHKTRKDTGNTSSPSVPTAPPASETARISSTAPTRLFSFSFPRAALPVTPAITTSSADADKAAGSLSVTEPQLKSEVISPCDLGVTSLHEAASTSDSASLPVRSSPSSARTGPVKTGGRVFVLDHRRWPAPMKTAIDDLLNKHRGQKDMLKLVDQVYAALVHSSSTDPNIHKTHQQNFEHVLFTHTSPEKLEQTQSLWQSLTAGSTTTTVPVVVMPPAAVNPSPPALTVTPPLSQETLEKIVQGIVEKQQYFYCSTKVFNTYGAEGLTDPRMPFKDFVATEFFQRELEATRQRVEERQQQKRKREESPAPGRKCRFCKLELKQGPNSPHIHTSFPGLPGKYIYCPAKVFSAYREQGMEREMSWRQFQQSPFYEKEKERWGKK